MGQTMSEPITTKQSDCCENVKFKVGSSCMQGWRVSMEDAHTHLLEIEDDTAFFAVYDGHGGSAISKHASANLHKFILQRPEYKSGDIPGAFKSAFLEFDQSMQNDEKLKNELSGTTAITCLIKGNKLYCGNVGDSRAIACIDGKCEPLSFDHKPTNPGEEERIRQAGGWVEFNRVNGNLALSRALGDFQFKRNPTKTPEEQMVCALPDVMEKTIDPSWEFVLICCDGVYDVLTNEEACELVRYPLGNGLEPQKVCEELLQTCLAPDCQMGGLGCDNMTAILICFLHGESWSDYCSKIANTLDSSLEYSRTRDCSEVESSDDDDDVIPLDKMTEAKSAAESLLCLSLSKRDSLASSGSKEFVDNSAEQLQKAMANYMYANAEAQEAEQSGSNVSNRTSNSNSADLLGGLKAELLSESYKPPTPTPSQSMEDPGKSEPEPTKAKK